MIQELNTKAGKLLVVEVPEECKYNLGISTNNKVFGDTNDSANWNEFSIQLPKGKHKILGKFNELEDKDFEEFVDITHKGGIDIIEGSNLKSLKIYKNYPTSECGIYDRVGYYTAEDSFTSLAKSQNINLTDNSLLIRVL